MTRKPGLVTPANKSTQSKGMHRGEFVRSLTVLRLKLSAGSSRHRIIEERFSVFSASSFRLNYFWKIDKMNQQTRDMNSFLAEQAMLLANNSVSLTQISRPVSLSTNNKQQNIQNSISSPRVESQINIPSSPSSSSASNLSKYSQLLLVLEEMGKDIRWVHYIGKLRTFYLLRFFALSCSPTYSGSRSSAERLKRTIVHARILVRECLLETERQQSGRQ